jgi:hypothetical protein
MGKSRRITSPDSLVICHLNETGETRQVSPLDTLNLTANAVAAPFAGITPAVAACLPARKLAQQVLKDCAMNRDTFARGAAGISLLCAARIETGVVSP